MCFCFTFVIIGLRFGVFDLYTWLLLVRWALWWCLTWNVKIVLISVNFKKIQPTKNVQARSGAYCGMTHYRWCLYRDFTVYVVMYIHFCQIIGMCHNINYFKPMYLLPKLWSGHDFECRCTWLWPLKVFWVYHFYSIIYRRGTMQRQHKWK